MPMTTDVADAGQTRPRRPILLGIGLALVAVVALGGYWFFTEGPGWPVISPRGSTVAMFSGDGDLTTATFRVREGWRIRWEASGQAFAMGIEGDVNMGTVVRIDAPDSGLTAPPREGTFRLEIRATGPWTATILQGR